VRLERLGDLKNPVTIGIQCRDLPACSIVPQPTTLQRVPSDVDIDGKKRGTQSQMYAVQQAAAIEYYKFKHLHANAYFTLQSLAVHCLRSISSGTEIS
jgi:hypothetical protein